MCNVDENGPLGTYVWTFGPKLVEMFGKDWRRHLVEEGVSLGCSEGS